MICSNFFILSRIISVSDSSISINRNFSTVPGKICFSGNIIKKLVIPSNVDSVRGRVIYLESPNDTNLDMFFISGEGNIFPMSRNMYTTEVIQKIIDNPILAEKIPTLKLLLSILNL